MKSQYEKVAKNKIIRTDSIYYPSFTKLKHPYWPSLKRKKPTTFVMGFNLRRKRDSNPRRCDPQQFSRLPHSTTLPFLRASHQVFPDCGCKYITLFQFDKIFFELFSKKFILSIYISKISPFSKSIVFSAQ